MSASEEVPDGLARSHRSWIQAVNRTDLAAYADLVCEDIVWLAPGREAFRGRDAFRSWLDPFFQRYAYQFSVEDSSIRVAGDWAFEKGYFRSVMTSRSDGTAMEHTGGFVILWRKDEDARWRIERYVDDTVIEDTSS